MRDQALQKRDMPLIDRVDLPAALGLLTRLPVRVDGTRAMARGAASAWAYPLVGVVLGVILAALAALLTWAGLPAAIVAGLVLALAVIMTGAMHEDGLADSADGLWGGWDRDRRLEIMKDSHIGVYGVCAIALSLLLRWLALTAVIAVGGYWVALIAVGALSRGSMVLVMTALENARAGGLSRQVGRPAGKTATLTALIALVASGLCGFALLVPAALLAAWLCGAIAKAKIGGQTGDILGATQQIAEIATLLVAVLILT